MRRSLILLIDDRESDSVFQLLYESPEWTNEKIRTHHLPTGDYIFSYLRKGKGWVASSGWESKTWEDLAQSATKKTGGRLFHQLTRLQATYPFPGLLVKGTRTVWTHEANPLERRVILGGEQSGWTVKALDGLLLTVQDRGIRVVKVEDPKHLPFVLRWLHDHYKKLVTDVDGFSKASGAVAVSILDTIPGVSPAMAERLHQTFDPEPDSIRGVIGATKEELEEAVGNYTAQEIYRRLH